MVARMRGMNRTISGMRPRPLKGGADANSIHDANAVSRRGYLSSVRANPAKRLGSCTGIWYFGDRFPDCRERRFSIHPFATVSRTPFRDSACRRWGRLVYSR